MYEFDECHTAKNNAEKLLQIVASYDEKLLDKVVGRTHDAASNNTGHQFVASVPWKIRICCWAHKASNASKCLFANDKDAARVLHIARRLTHAFGQQHAWSALQQAQESRIKVLPRFSDTRFNGGYLVFIALLEQRVNIEKALNDLEERYPKTYRALTKNVKGTADYCSIPTRNDWRLMAELVAALRPLQIFIEDLQDRELTLLGALMLFRALKLRLKDVKSPTTFHVQLLEHLRHYFHDVEESTSAFLVAFALDPRCVKTAIPEATWKFIAEDIFSVTRATTIEEKSKEPTTDASKTSDADRLHAAMMGVPVSVLHAQPAAVPDDVLSQLVAFRKIQPLRLESSASEFWNTSFATSSLPLLRAYAARYHVLQPTEVENEREFFSTG